MPGQKVVKCVRMRFARSKYTYAANGNCCVKCVGAFKDQSLISYDESSILSSGDCESIVYHLSSPQTLQSRVGREYESVRMKLKIPIDNSDDPEYADFDRVILINGLINEQNISFVEKFNEIVDDLFVLEIEGTTKRDCELIAIACRAARWCKILTMCQNAEFDSVTTLLPDFIWFVIRQVDVLLQQSLSAVRSNSIMDKESSSQLVIWYYAVSNLRTYMGRTERGRCAKLFGNNLLFRHVLKWVRKVWGELNSRWKTACGQNEDYYRGIKTPHEEMAKRVRNFMKHHFDMSMWELPIESYTPSGDAEFSSGGAFTDWSPVQYAFSSAGETREHLDNDDLYVWPRSLQVPTHNSSVTSASFELPINIMANPYNYFYHGMLNYKSNPHLEQHSSDLQYSQTEGNFLKVGHQSLTPTKGNAKSSFDNQDWEYNTYGQYQYTTPIKNQPLLPHYTCKAADTNFQSGCTEFSRQQRILTSTYPDPQQNSIANVGNSGLHIQSDHELKNFPSVCRN